MALGLRNYKLEREAEKIEASKPSGNVSRLWWFVLTFYPKRVFAPRLPPLDCTFRELQESVLLN